MKDYPVAWNEDYLEGVLNRKPRRKDIACYLTLHFPGTQFFTHRESQANGVCDVLREHGWIGNRSKKGRFFFIKCLGRRAPKK